MPQIKEMEMALGTQKIWPKTHVRNKDSNENQLTIKLPHSRVLRIIARSLLLAIMIAALPWLNSILFRPGDADFESKPYLFNDLFVLPMLFRDLAHHGLLKFGDRALFIGEGVDEARLRLQVLEPSEINVISGRDFRRQSSIPDESFDFAFTDGFQAPEFIDRTLKIGGVATVHIGSHSSKSFRVPPNFKIVYLRKFDGTLVGMKKMDPSGIIQSSAKRRLLSFPYSSYYDAKVIALKGLEDVLLEPPRTASMESKYYLKRTKFLPDLTRDSLEGYPRRVFIDAGEIKNRMGSSSEWFERHYPTRNLDFDIYKVETVAEGGALGMSEWMRRNVKEQEYVVMQAEAEVVEEMVKSKAISLVDELFLECNHQGQKGKNNRKFKRAYWECLALYGKLRDQGVAVHQWWG